MSLRWRFPICMLVSFVLWPMLSWQDAWASSREEGTRVNLAAVATEAVDSDEVVVDFRVVAEGKDVAALAARVDQASQRILTQLKAEKGLQLRTRNRHLQAVSHYERAAGKTVRDGWRLEQQSRIRSRRLDAVAGWLAKIEQAGARLDRLQYGVSRETLARVRSRLRQRAIAGFRRQAGEIAGALAATDYRILQLTTDSYPPGPPMRTERMMMAVSSDGGRPALTPGKEEVTLRVSGQILLPEKTFPAIIPSPSRPDGR